MLSIHHELKKFTAENNHWYAGKMTKISCDLYNIFIRKEVVSEIDSLINYVNIINCTVTMPKIANVMYNYGFAHFSHYWQHSRL